MRMASVGVRPRLRRIFSAFSFVCGSMRAWTAEVFIALLSPICNTNANRFSRFCFLVFVQQLIYPIGFSQTFAQSYFISKKIKRKNWIMKSSINEFPLLGILL